MSVLLGESVRGLWGGCGPVATTPSLVSNNPDLQWFLCQQHGQQWWWTRVALSVAHHTVPQLILSLNPSILLHTSMWIKYGPDPSRSGRVVYSAVLAARTVVGSSPEPPPMLTDTSATWIKKARLPCWPLYSQQVSHQRWISGIHCMQVTKHASEGSTLALKPRADITRSPKQEYQWPHEKYLCPPKI